MTDGFTGTLTPMWIVYVDGRRLDTEHEGALKRIFINDALNAQGACRLLFTQDLSSRGILTLFSTVHVYIGYKDEVKCVFCGDITARQFRLDKDGCRFEIRCANAIHRMQHGMQNIVYENKTPSDILRAVIERHGLHAEVEEFGPVYEFKVQRCCTDFEFVRDLARSYGKEVYAQDNSVYVQDEIRLSTEQLLYEKGKSLISCRAEQSLIYEKEAVFIDTDMQSRESIESSSTHPEGGKHKQYIKEYCIDNEDAHNRAYGYMKNALKEYRRADIRVTGDPRLKPGMRVELKYVDNDTDGEYIVERVKHELNAAGYVTEAQLYKPIRPTGKPRDRVHTESPKEEKQEPEERKEKAAISEELSKRISNLAWKKNGTVVTKAFVGEEVSLYAETQNIADGTAATIRVVEKDADGNNNEAATLKTIVQNGKIRHTFDANLSNKEKKLAFIIKAENVSSNESGGLNIVIPKVSVQFRTSGNYTGEYGFDWLRGGDSGRAGDTWYAEIMGTCTGEGDNFKKDVRVYDKYVANEFGGKKQYKIFWKKGKNNIYTVPIMTLLKDRKAVLTLKIETAEEAETLQYVYDKHIFEITEHKTPNLSTGKRTMGDAISILCKEEFAKDQIIEVYAYGRKGNEKTKQLAGKLIVKANDKKHQHTINVALVNVITDIGHKKDKLNKIGTSIIENISEKLKRYFDQCYVNLEIVEKDLDVIITADERISFSNFTTLYETVKYPISDALFSFLLGKFSAEFSSYKDYYKIFLINMNCNAPYGRNTYNLKGQARGENKKEVIVFQAGFYGSTAIHELMHAFGLYHSFSSSNNYSWEKYTTDNIMDYVRDKDIRIAAWQYQWEKINPNMN